VEARTRNRENGRRTVFQTNEHIHVIVIRYTAQPLAAAEMIMTLAEPLGCRMPFTFDVPAVPVVEGQARSTEHVCLNGWLIRPCAYTLAVLADDATALMPVDTAPGIIYLNCIAIVMRVSERIAAANVVLSACGRAQAGFSDGKLHRRTRLVQRSDRCGSVRLAAVCDENAVS